MICNTVKSMTIYDIPSVDTGYPQAFFSSGKASFFYKNIQASFRETRMSLFNENVFHSFQYQSAYVPDKSSLVSYMPRVANQ